MARLAIVGGALQGMEAVFLARKAGIESVVIDRKPTAPALSVCDESHVLNPLEDPEEAKRVFSSCDAVIPAVEELDILHFLSDTVPSLGMPLLFDMHAYEISCSKNRSNEIMQSVGVPLPQPWPQCGFPAIVKPSSQSGSIGVKVAFNDRDMQDGLRFIESIHDEPVIQEFVHGKSVSIEVIGNGRTAKSYVTTEVVLDDHYDCKMVRCNDSILSAADEEVFARVGKDVAEAIGLGALMDVEAILTPRGLRVLEIDARIPSQTPAAICEGTGVNLLEELFTTALGKPADRPRRPGAGIYRHVYLKDGVLRTCGEKTFGHVRNPRMGSGLFGSDDFISDYEPGKEEWYATLMYSCATEEEADRRAAASIEKIMDECSVTEYIDGSPEVLR